MRKFEGRRARWMRASAACGVLVLTMAASATFASPSTRIGFTNVATDPARGLAFERERSATFADLQAFYDRSVVTPQPFGATLFTPHRTGGLAGVALIDHDSDGDLDVFVTNGPGAPNALFDNQLAQTGTATFVDIGAASGAGTEDLDANGVCFGDLDNDGDSDLVVLGRNDANRLLENVDGHFVHRGATGAEGGTSSHTGCTLGDIDGDGDLDLFVGNGFDFSDLQPLTNVPFASNQRNQLFRNDGGFVFTDVSGSTGIHVLTGLDTLEAEPATLTWAVGMVDVDDDGDIDIVQADDQAALPPGYIGGVDRGKVHVLLNDGSGQFTDQVFDENDFAATAWMGLAFGDLDCDAHMDVFATSFGDYGVPTTGFPLPYDFGRDGTRWLLGRGDGTFADSLAGGQATAFGWGNAIADLDHDGDLDLLYHGGLDVGGFAVQDNPGVVLRNEDCSAEFTLDVHAFRGDYTRRGTQGVATGDLDGDGYVDVVTTAHHRIPEGVPLAPATVAYGSPLDATALYFPQLAPVTPTGEVSWIGVSLLPGDVTVELNDGGSNHFVGVTARGTVGQVTDARNNRDGIGAVVTVTPLWGHSVSQPVMGGSSFLSQHALERLFGLDRAWLATVDVRWVGGTRNRLYAAWKGERLVLHEIPCSIDATEPFWDYASCVTSSLGELQAAGELTWLQALRRSLSALLAYGAP